MSASQSHSEGGTASASAGDGDVVVTYECPVAGNRHAVPGPDVRILKVGDGGFVIACGCGPEALAAADEAPHPTVDHLVNVYVDDPSPEEWLRLETAADGWYDTTQWETPDGFSGTNGQRRAQMREQIEAMAEDADRNRRGGASAEDRQARAVPCPSCGADEQRKCKRPGGHRVRRSHSERRAAARDQGLLEDDDAAESSPQQAGLGEFGSG